MMGAEFRYRANFTFSMRWAEIATLGLIPVDIMRDKKEMDPLKAAVQLRTGLFRFWRNAYPRLTPVEILVSADKRLVRTSAW
jgi:hypothetical protein